MIRVARGSPRFDSGQPWRRPHTAAPIRSRRRVVVPCVLLVLLSGDSSLAGSLWPWSRPAAPPTPPHPAVVRVLAEEPDGIAQGSGTLVDTRGPYGLIVTNWHVVRDAAGPINVVFPDGFRSAARVLQVDRDWDLAALLIWRPAVAAVPLAQQAPRPGDLLTIAGYGSGTYRAATGRCTQYVAPSAHHPYEMVEVSATARQGDSGGPIFNERGELAGVLFGSVSGTTSGSYAGRIRQFLASAWPPPKSPDQAVATASALPEEGRPLHRLPDVESSAEQVAQLTPLPPYQGRAGNSGAPHLERATEAKSTSEDAQPTRSATVQWSDLAGTTLYEQVKTVLAVIGLAAFFLRLTGAGHHRPDQD